MKIDKISLRVEYSQLNSRIDFLKRSIMNAENGVDKSDKEEIALAKSQLSHMENYRDVLLSRCSKYKVSF